MNEKINMKNKSSNNLELINTSIFNSKNLLDLILNDKDLLNKISEIADFIYDALSKENKIIFAGNGGSAADAQHLAAEFIVRYRHNRKSLPSISLSADTSIITAIGNDFGYEKIFSRQLEGLVRSGDIFLAMTTSGNSINILEALAFCKENNIFSIVLTGDNKNLEKKSDIILNIPSKETARIQEAHILIGHIICEIVENKVYLPN